MTLADIDARISAMLPEVVLGPDTFGSDPALSALLRQYFSATGGKIAVSGVTRDRYTFDPAAGVIRFSGTGSGGPFGGMTVAQATVTLPGGAPRLVVEGHAPDGWTLHGGFPEMESPVLRSLPFTAPALWWASYEDDDTTQGFFFSGTLDLDADPLDAVKMFFPGLQGPELSGDIGMQGTAAGDVVQYVPDAVLTVDETADTATLGPFTLHGPQLKVFASPVFNAFTRTWQSSTRVRVATFLQFRATWFQFILDIRDVRHDLVFEALLDQPLGAALADLADFVGGTALGIPGFQLQLPDGLLLKDVRAGFDPAARALKYVALEIDTADGEKWNLWQGADLEKISIVFHLTPGDGGGYVVGGEVSGEVDGWLGLRAAFASDGNYTFYGALSQPVPIGQVYRFFTGSDNPDLPDLTVDSLSFTLDRTQGSGVKYAGEVTVDGRWTVVTQPVEIALDGLLFRIGNDGGTHFEAGAVLGVADYTVGVDASYDSAAGWTFQGEVALDGEGADLAGASGKIESTFPVDAGKSTALPPFLRDWAVERMDVLFTTGNKDFHFTLTAGTTRVPELQLGLGVHLTHADAAFTRELDGTATIATDSWHAKLSVGITETSTPGPPPSRSFAATGTYSSDPESQPRLSDFLRWVAGTLGISASLPQELQVDAAVDDVALLVGKRDQDPTVLEAAAEFSLRVEGSDWELFFAYTNATSFTPDGPPALVGWEPAHVFGAALGGALDLSRLPLVGRIPGVGELRIDRLGFFHTDAAFPDAAAQLHFRLPAIGDPGKLAPDPAGAVLTRPGFNLVALFGPPSAPSGTLAVPLDTGTAPQGKPAFATGQATPKDPVHWLGVNRTLGPVTLNRVGLAYEKPADPATQLGTVSFYLDGAFQLAGLAMALDRLGVTLRLPRPGSGSSFDPVRDADFHLGGLFVGYQAPDLLISGGFVTLPGPGTSLVGEFVVQAGEYGLQAYGGFSDQGGEPSLFLFLHVEAPIGGPPFFFVNGLAGGFGVNRSFRLPTFDQLTSYPFLPASTPIPGPSQLGGDPQSRLATLTRALVALADYVPVTHGEYWLAVGLDVSSFEMIEVSAVLSVAFGVSFQVGVVGSASMTLPVKEPEPLAYVQIDFEVDFTPSSGLVAVLGKITPASFLYGGMVHLSGGFAFYTWFAGPQRGDFVLTVGGYNPRYRKPAQYPDVPRLQARFGIDRLDVVGQAYFALVPHAMMAGLDIHATWSLGGLQAWFDAGMDFLLNWKPFHYEADARVQIGVSLTIHVAFVRVRITVHAGVTLHLWGPPLGGRAVVDLDVVSFTIDFGRGQVRETVDWTGFRQFLPSVAGDTTGHAMLAAGAATGDRPLVDLAVAEGLLRSFDGGGSPDGLDWLVDPGGFRIATRSTAPCTDASLNGRALRGTPAAEYLDPADLPGGVAAALAAHGEAPFFAYRPAAGEPAWDTLQFGVPPMSLADLRSTHAVSVYALDDAGNEGAAVDDLIVLLETQSFPRSLWGTSGVGPGALQGGGELVRGALGGFAVVPMLWFPRRTTSVPYYSLVFEENDLFLERDAIPALDPTPVADPDAVYAAMESGAAFSATAGARASAVAALRECGFAGLQLEDDSAMNTGQYAGDPILAHLRASTTTLAAGTP